MGKVPFQSYQQHHGRNCTVTRWRPRVPGSVSIKVLRPHNRVAIGPVLPTARLFKCACSISISDEHELEDRATTEAKEIHKEAIKLRNEGDLDEALAVLEEGLLRFPNNVFFLTTSAVIYGRKRKYERAEELFKRVLDIDPKSSTALQAWGCLEFGRGNFKKAELHCRNSILVNPKHASAYQMLGRIHLLKNNVEEARSMYNKAIEVDPKHLQSLHALAQLERQSGNEDTGRELLKRILKIHDSNCPALLSLGELEWKQGKKALATSIFENGAKKQSKAAKQAMLINAWGKLEAEANNIPRAKQLYKRVLEEINPSDVCAMVSLGVLESKRGNVLIGAQLIKKACTTHPNNTFAKHSLAQLYRVLGQSEDAKVVLKDLLETHPQCGAAWHALGQVLTDLGDVNAAMKSFNQGMQCSDSVSSLMCYGSLAEVYYFLGRYAQARQSYVQGAKVHRASARYLCNWASMERRLQAKDEATRLFRAATKANCREKTAWLKWALHERGLGNFERAEHCYKCGLKYFPTNPVLWYGYATMCRDNKDPGYARKVFEAAVKACPRDGPLLLEMALFEQSLGNTDAARSLYKTGSRLPVGDSHPPLIQAWSDLEAGLGDIELADKLKAQYLEAMNARDTMAQKGRIASLRVLKSEEVM